MKKFVFCFLCFMVGVCSDAQILKTYKGDYADFGGIYILYPKATYTYYEADDLSRVYHGSFSLTYTGDGTTRTKKVIGSIKGQFENGKMSGDWTFVYPMKVYFPNTTLYTAVLKCSFVDGKLNGPLSVVVTNPARKTVAKTTLNYDNGCLDGEIHHFGKSELSELSGQYVKGHRSGIWRYVYNGDKGIACYENSGYPGEEKYNYVIDSRTGKKDYGHDITFSDMFYGSSSLANMINVFVQIANMAKSEESEEWDYVE